MDLGVLSMSFLIMPFGTFRIFLFLLLLFSLRGFVKGGDEKARDFPSVVDRG